MKIVILSALCVIAAIASPLLEDGPSSIAEEVSPFFDVFRDTRLLVFTRFNPTIGQVVVWNDMSTVAATQFSPARPTRFLIHGWNR